MGSPWPLHFRKNVKVVFHGIFTVFFLFLSSCVNDLVYNIFDWIKEDCKSHPFRFVIEVLAWMISIGCSLTMALTVPNPPLIYLYPIWIIGCSMYAWAAYTRRSFGMIANYLLLVTIDSVGLIRLIIA